VVVSNHPLTINFSSGAGNRFKLFFHHRIKLTGFFNLTSNLAQADAVCLSNLCQDTFVSSRTSNVLIDPALIMGYIPPNGNRPKPLRLPLFDESFIFDSDLFIQVTSSGIYTLTFSYVFP